MYNINLYYILLCICLLFLYIIFYKHIVYMFNILIDSYWCYKYDIKGKKNLIIDLKVMYMI